LATVVSVRDLKNRTSEFLRRVRAGERLVVTDRGRPIAEIAPVRRERLSSEQHLGRLAERGDIVPARGRGLREIRPLRRRGRPVAASLLEDRE